MTLRMSNLRLREVVQGQSEPNSAQHQQQIKETVLSPTIAVRQCAHQRTDTVRLAARTTRMTNARWMGADGHRRRRAVRRERQTVDGRGRDRGSNARQRRVEVIGKRRRRYRHSGRRWATVGREVVNVKVWKTMSYVRTFWSVDLYRFIPILKRPLVFPNNNVILWKFTALSSLAQLSHCIIFLWNVRHLYASLFIEVR